MNVRRIVEYRGRTIDHEPLQIITVYEEGLRKKNVNKMNPYSKTHSFLANRRKRFKLIEE